MQNFVMNVERSNKMGRYSLTFIILGLLLSFLGYIGLQATIYSSILIILGIAIVIKGFTLIGSNSKEKRENKEPEEDDDDGEDTEEEIEDEQDEDDEENIDDSEENELEEDDESEEDEEKPTKSKSYQYCKECGKKIPKSSKFCRECGELQ